MSDKIVIALITNFLYNEYMHTDVKYAYKTSYRINNRIKSIISGTAKDIRRETGLKLSLGKLSRAFWVSLAADPVLRKKFIHSACKMMVEEATKRDNKYYYVSPKRTRNKQRGNRKCRFMRKK